MAISFPISRAGLVGGLGIVPGANLGDNMAVFEAVHGTAPDIAGQGKANPTALMQSARLMLAHIGEREASQRLQKAIEAVYAEGIQTYRRSGRQSLDRRIHRRGDCSAIGNHRLCVTFTTSRVLEPAAYRAVCWIVR